MPSSPSSGAVPRGSRVAALAAAAALACASGAPPAPPPGPRATGEWVQVWSDEFTGPARSGIETTKWRFDTADGCAQSNCGWGNNEKEYYSASSDNITLNGQGQLQIVARVAPGGLACYYGPCRYTSAKITTHGKICVSPGRVEARITLAPGQGLWPAIWLLGKNIETLGWPAGGELDIMENHGSDITTTSSAVHGPGYSGNTPFAHALPPGSLDSGFHRFAIEWDSLHIRFFVDDAVHYVVSKTDVQQHGNWVYDQPFFLILNLAIGGHFDGDPQSDAIFPATMQVDYVRVFRRGG